MKNKLLEIGNELAMLYGGSCYDYYKSGGKIIFKCIEHGEHFTTSMTVKELKEEYGIDITSSVPKNPKNITIAVYYFGDDKIVFKKPFPIVRETEKCFYSDYTSVRKDTLGKAIFRKGEGSPYLVVEAIDKNEEELRILFADWFANKANQMKG